MRSSGFRTAKNPLPSQTEQKNQILKVPFGHPSEVDPDPPQPLQLVVKPKEGEAVRVTTVALTKEVAQVEGQVIPEGFEVTTPLPPLVTVSDDVGRDCVVADWGGDCGLVLPAAS